jgi:hypothetical protein
VNEANAYSPELGAARPRRSRLGTALPETWHGRQDMSGRNLGGSRRCFSRLPFASLGAAMRDQARRGTAMRGFFSPRQDTTRRGLAVHGSPRPAMTRPFMAGLGPVSAGLDVAGLPSSGRDMERRGGAGRCTARLPSTNQGKSWSGWTWPDLARLPFSVHGVARRGAACPDRARQGSPHLRWAPLDIAGQGVAGPYSPGHDWFPGRLRPGQTRLGPAELPYSGPGTARARYRSARLGSSPRGQAGHGITVQVPAWLFRGAAMLVFPRRCKPRRCWLQRVGARQVSGEARQSLVRHGSPRLGSATTARLVKVRLDPAGLVVVGHCWARLPSSGHRWSRQDAARLGSVTLTSSRRGTVRLDTAWQGSARLPRAIARHGEPPLGGARSARYGRAGRDNARQSSTRLFFPPQGRRQSMSMLGQARRKARHRTARPPSAGRGSRRRGIGPTRPGSTGYGLAWLPFSARGAASPARQGSTVQGSAVLGPTPRGQAAASRGLGTAGRDLTRHRNARRGFSPLPLSGQDQTWRYAARLGPGGAGGGRTWLLLPSLI